MKKVLFIFLLLSLDISFQVLAKPLQADMIFSNPDYSMVKFSPDGMFVSVYKVEDEAKSLLLFSPKTLDIELSLSIGHDNVLNDYYWLNNSQIILDITHNSKQIYLIGDVQDEQIVFRLVKIEGYLVDILPEQPKKLMFAKLRRNVKRSYNLYVIDIESLLSGDFDGAYEVEHDEAHVFSYHYDDQFKKVITIDYDKKKQAIVIKSLPISGGKWQTILTLKDTDYDLTPIGFITEDLLAVLTNKDSDKMVLRAFSIETQKLGAIIYQHPKYDLISAGFTNEGHLDFVEFKQHGLNQKLFFDKGKSLFRKRLIKTFPNQEIYIVDHADKEDIILLYANGSDQPGQYYLYNQKIDTAVNFLPAYIKLEDQKFVESKKLTIKTKDNIEIEAFLTLPVDVDHSVLLVMPHGGPIDVQESDRFNNTIQYYVSRGFSVLRVNFRGSSGFGKAFLQKGVGEFGKKIEQDIMDTVAKVKQDYEFKYQCAIGASYGGYSATMLAIYSPEEYDCVIAAFGIYDLPLLFNISNYRSGEKYQRNLEKVLGKYDDNLRSFSPLYLAKELNAPILLIAGRDDDTADFEHSNRFKYILNKLKHPIETMFYRNTSHGHHTWGGDIHEVALTYDFLMRTLNLGAPSPIQLDKSSKEAIADDYATIADGYSFNNSVDNDKEKAFQYYKKAAGFDHPRANFNIGSNYHRGEQVAKDMKKAVEYYKTAAKLEYANAYARLGRMYMEGEYFTQNWEFAFDNLSKAHELEDSPFNNIRLARYYCIAPEPYKNIEKCLSLMDLKQYKKDSKRKLNLAKRYIKEALAWIFTSAQLTTKENQKLKEFSADIFDLTEVKATIEDPISGQFKFEESDVFGKKGKYNLIPKQGDFLSSNDEDSRFGLIFKVDVPGLNSSRDKVAIAVRWIKTTPDGKRSYRQSTILHGSPTGTWQLLRSLKHLREAAYWTLEIYDFNQNLLYRNAFNVAPKKSRTTNI
jgi:dipeptidyl aminopeptidase/acylaminoacyl peptidase